MQRNDLILVHPLGISHQGHIWCNLSFHFFFFLCSLFARKTLKRNIFCKRPYCHCIIILSSAIYPIAIFMTSLFPSQVSTIIEILLDISLLHLHFCLSCSPYTCSFITFAFILDRSNLLQTNSRTRLRRLDAHQPLKSILIIIFIISLLFVIIIIIFHHSYQQLLSYYHYLCIIIISFLLIIIIIMFLLLSVSQLSSA